MAIDGRREKATDLGPSSRMETARVPRRARASTCSSAFIPYCRSQYSTKSAATSELTTCATRYMTPSGCWPRQATSSTVKSLGASTGVPSTDTSAPTTITTAPTVRYRVILATGEEQEIETPAALPSPADIDRIEEPMILATIHVPPDYLGAVLALCQERRGNQRDLHHHGSRVQVRYELPLADVVLDFHDRIKSITRGYGSMDYEHADYQPATMVKLDMLVNGEPVDAFSCIVHRDKAESRGRALAAKLREVIPRQQYRVAIQAAIGGKVIARESVNALRKDVTAKCYGGDITRKRKLLEKQKEGKKRMKSIGQVNIPQEAFIEVLKA